jgi:hypothetical protein
MEHQGSCEKRSGTDEKPMRNERQLARNSKRPARVFGVMVMERNKLEDRPTYHSILLKYGFIGRLDDTATAWQRWMMVCEDKKIVELAQEIKRQKYKLASITAAYQHTEKVLSLLSARQLKSLKQRVGVQPCAPLS